MSDRLTPVPFGRLVYSILKEHMRRGTIFGIHRSYHAGKDRTYRIFGRKLETPVGPVAGPHTQLAQNIAAAYVAGARFFSLKPIWPSEDEASDGLPTQDAFNEYIKAWFLLHIMAWEYGYGAADGFRFGLSVDCDLKKIQTKDMDDFIEGMKDASQTFMFRACRDWLLCHAHSFQHVTKEQIQSISPHLCNAVTLVIQPDCPVEEIEETAAYVLTGKALHTYLTYWEISETYESMIRRLMAVAEGQGLTLGVQLIPKDKVSLVSMDVAKKMAADFQGTLPISYSGDIDISTIGPLVQTGIWPVLVSTTLFKPGGYARLGQLAEIFKGHEGTACERVSPEAVAALADDVNQRGFYRQLPQTWQFRKNGKPLPLLNCFIAPCQDGCPLHQDIAAYMKLSRDGDFEGALRVILQQNPLPFTTGTICYHHCMNWCNRIFYEEPAGIRQTKLEAAEKGYDAVLADMPKKAAPTGKSVVIVGGGPAGLSAAWFLALAGVDVTIMDEAPQMGGLVRSCLCHSRHMITDEAIDKDILLIRSLGVRMLTGCRVTDISALRREFDEVILAIGAAEAGLSQYPGDETNKRQAGTGAIYKKWGLNVDERGRVLCLGAFEAANGVYVIGDGYNGISSVAECIAHGQIVAEGITGHPVAHTTLQEEPDVVYSRRGILKATPATGCDNRCLQCNTICEQCVEACPNRANVAIALSCTQMHQIIHLDYACSGCGNCRTFCPWGGAPYQDKFTLFADGKALDQGGNDGFAVLDKDLKRCIVRLHGKTVPFTVGMTCDSLPDEIQQLIKTVIDEYEYLLL